MSYPVSTNSSEIPPELLPYFTGQLHDYSTVRDSIYRFNITFSVLVITALAMRVYVRYFMLRAAGLDDVLMIVAAFSALVQFSVAIVGAHYGLGIHIWNLDINLLNIQDEASRLVKIEFAAYVSYATAVSLTKFAIIASYIRFFPHKYLRRIAFGTGAVVAAFWVISLFAICFACYPIQALWDWTIADAKCFDLVNYFYVAAAFNIATDVILCILPIPAVWSLKMLKAQRFAVSMLFSFGIFACIASILRISQLYNLSASDISYRTVSPLNWSTAEVGTGLVCTCMSALRPLASKIFPKLFEKLFTQASRPTNDSYVATRVSRISISNLSKSQNDPQNLASHSEDGYELIHKSPDNAEQWPPGTPPEIPFEKVVIARNSKSLDSSSTYR